MTLRGRGKMSDKVEFSNNLFNIAALHQPGMISIRTDIRNKNFQKFIRDFLKINVPKKLEFTSNKNLYLAWMSPNELLLISKNVNEVIKLKSIIEDLLNGIETLVLEVSSSRTIFSIKGSLWRELLAKGTPINLCPNKFNSSSFRRTRLGQVSTAFWMVKIDHIYVVCGRSFEEFFFKWLCNAAEEKSITKFF